MRYLWLSLLACWACSASAQLVVNGVDYSSNPGLGRQVQADEMAKQHMMQQQQMQQTWQAPPTIVRNITVYVPNRFGAVAVNYQKSHVVMVSNRISREEAEAAALSACRARGKTGNCQIFVSYGNECVAMVEGLQRENGKKEPYLMYSTVPPEREGTAEDDAMRKCTERGYEECRVVLPEECSQYIYEPIRPLRG